ncbi:hypothetical protein ACHHYP_17245 [Achlya hypogyna]|uniref:Uncharacterized protein n=1 Tax=Achlya hypogyna TaxID=1202772 RepID=A0A1V9Y4U0_ACHHY|nr:hypothetical protein ACHHYP_17245 [Achlya hypogyna]
MQMLVADADVWDEYLKHNPSAKKFRNRPFELYLKLSEICTGIVAIGNSSVTGDEVLHDTQDDAAQRPPSPDFAPSPQPAPQSSDTRWQPAPLQASTTSSSATAAPTLGIVQRTKKRVRDDSKNPKMHMTKAIKALADSNHRVAPAKTAMTLFDLHYEDRGYSAAARLTFFCYLSDNNGYCDIFTD